MLNFGTRDVLNLATVNFNIGETNMLKQDRPPGYVQVSDIALPKERRVKIDDANFSTLRESIRLHGILNPITVRTRKVAKNGRPYGLVDGLQRLRAAEVVGLKYVPIRIIPKVLKQF